jgi:hypothetical protein
MRRLIGFSAAAAMCVLLLPAAARAQASITGVVKDASGAVLPGVTVEASSPALIEKVRAAVTDGSGQYRIENLRPGDYEVTFALTGFRSVRRQGIELTGSFVATVNADLQVGSLEETVTVSGEAPVVDVQSAKRQEVLSNDVVAAIPTGRSYNALMVLIPGVAVTSADVATGPCGACTFGVHGRNNEGRVQIDGIGQGASLAGTTSGLITDPGNAQEVNVTTSGGLGEAETSGPIMNFVPKTGGNTVHGSFFSSGSNSAMQGDNFTPELRAAGLVAPSSLQKAWDVNASTGGPLMKDKLWFFVTGRTQGAVRTVTNMYLNLNAGKADAWTYVPDLAHQAFHDRTWENASLRLTWQAATRAKFGVFWDEQAICRPCTGAGPQNGFPSPTTSPEALGHGEIGPPSRTQQITFTSPATNKLLFEAGWGTTLQRYGGQPGDSPDTIDLTRVTEQCTAGCAANGNIPGLIYRSQDWSSIWNAGYLWRGSASYVTGAHSMKFGYQGGLLTNERTAATNTTYLAFRVNNAVPNQLTMQGLPFYNADYTRYGALYAQEQWTHGRWTLQGAVRYDNAWSYTPDLQVGPVRWIPVPVAFAAQDLVNWKDITPKMGAAWDVTGNGKTAVRVNLGKYLDPARAGGTYSGPNPLSRISTSITRTWTDANRDYVPNCDLLSPVAQDLRTGGGDFCGAMSNLNFGKPVFSNTYDPELLTGWGKRPSDWSFGASVQREVIPRVSVEVGYYRRWWGNFVVTDNLAVTASDFTPFSVVAPADSRLPGGGGNSISGLSDVDPLKFGQTNNFITLASHYGNQYENFNAVDVTVNARMKNGLTVQGGTSTGQGVTDNCEIKAQLPELSPTNPYCHTATGFLTQFRGLASYTIPKVDVLVSGTFQSVQGPVLAGNYALPAGVATAALGRPAAGASILTVNLVAPGALYGDRTNQLDFRAGKILKFGKTRTQVSVDVYNVLNSAAVLGLNQTFILGGAWLTPNSVLTARFVRISGQFDF